MPKDQKLVIGVDCDGVLADFMTTARVYLRMLFPEHFNDIFNMPQTSFGLDSFGVTPEEEKEFWDFVRNKPNFWLHLAPLYDTDKLEQLAYVHDVHFVTNRFTTGNIPADLQTEQWLARYFGLLPSQTHGKIHLSSNKGKEAAKLKPDFFIDDKPENLIDVLHGSPDTRVVLHDAPYNSKSWMPFVYSFNEFASLILGE